MGLLMNEHYQTLELDPDASLEEVKKSYRRLVKIYHPDKHPNDSTATGKFTEITNAYDEIVKLKTQLQEEPSKSFTLTVDMVANYLGTIIELDGEHFKIPVGLISGDKAKFSSPSKGIVEFSIILREQKGFTTKGRDLYTSIEVDEKDIRKGKTFNVPNHPYLLGRPIAFPKDAQHETTYTFHRCGLVNTNVGNRGDLFVKVLFKQTPIKNYSFLKKALLVIEGFLFSVSVLTILNYLLD